jgi:hypothetical protein
MANRAGLRKVVKTVRTKKGSVRRSYWVRAGQQVKAGGLSAAAVGALVSGTFVGGSLGQRAGASLASRRAGQIFQAGLAGGTVDSLNRGAAATYNHMNVRGYASGIAGAVGGAILGGALAGRLANVGARHGLFKRNTVWARRIGASAGLLGGIVLSYHAERYAAGNRAEQFRDRYNARVQQARGEV